MPERRVAAAAARAPPWAAWSTFCSAPGAAPRELEQEHAGGCFAGLLSKRRKRDGGIGKQKQKKHRVPLLPPGPVPAASPDVRSTIEVARRLLPDSTLTDFQAGWCTPRVVSVYLDGRQGDPEKAGAILARALEWRQRYKEVLLGRKEPNWQSDLRVLTRSDDGSPLIYACCANQGPVWETQGAVEHTAAVFEAAVKSMRNGATSFDVVVDTYGFAIKKNLVAGPIVACLETLKYPYRDRLRRGVVVGAPMGIVWLWKVAKGVLPAKTASKVVFLSREEAVEHLRLTAGETAAKAVESVMEKNRSEETRDVGRLPSELPEEEEEEDDDHGSSPAMAVVRILSRKFSRAFSSRNLSEKAAGEEKDSGRAGTAVLTVVVCAALSALAAMWLSKSHGNAW